MRHLRRQRQEEQKKREQEQNPEAQQLNPDPNAIQATEQKKEQEPAKERQHDKEREEPKSEEQKVAEMRKKKSQYSPGAFFGELLLVGHSRWQHATVFALEHTILIVFSTNLITKLVKV